MYTIADAMRDCIIENEAKYGNDDWCFDAGCLSIHHEAFEKWASAHDMDYATAAKSRHPNAIRQLVRDACCNTKRGKELFESDTRITNYPGIINAPCRVITLRPEYRKRLKR